MKPRAHPSRLGQTPKGLKALQIGKIALKIFSDLVIVLEHVPVAVKDVESVDSHQSPRLSSRSLP